MKILSLNLLSLIFLITLISCGFAPKKQEAKSELKIALGYYEHQMDVLKKVEHHFTSAFKDTSFKPQFLLIKAQEVDFNKKEVEWHLGFGGTAFALKEIAEGINFYPLMIEKSCQNSIELYQNGSIKSKRKLKVLAINQGYISPIFLLPLYPHAKNIIEINSISADDFLKYKDQIKNYNFILNLKTTIKFYDKLLDRSAVKEIDEKLFKKITLNIPNLPCRTLFYSPLLGEKDKDYTLSTIKKFQENNIQDVRMELTKVNDQEFQNYKKLFDWNLDTKLRLLIKEF